MLLQCIAMIRFLISRIFWRLDVHLTFLVVLISLVYGGRYLFYRFHSYLSFHFPSFCLSYQPFSFSTPILIVSISIFLNRPPLYVPHLCNLNIFLSLSLTLVLSHYILYVLVQHNVLLSILFTTTYHSSKEMCSLNKNRQKHLSIKI